MGGCCCKSTDDASEDDSEDAGSRVNSRTALHSMVDLEREADCERTADATSVDAAIVTGSSALATPVSACSRQPSLDKQQTSECCICLSSVSLDTKAILVPCIHSDFHDDCVKPWLRRKATCPLCEQTVDGVIYDLGRRPEDGSATTTSRTATRTAAHQYRTWTVPKQDADDLMADRRFAQQLLLRDLFGYD